MLSQSSHFCSNVHHKVLRDVKAWSCDNKACWHFATLPCTSGSDLSHVQPAESWVHSCFKVLTNWLPKLVSTDANLPELRGLPSRESRSRHRPWIRGRAISAGSVTNLALVDFSKFEQQAQDIATKASWCLTRTA